MSSLKPLVIVGNGGFGRELLELIQDLNKQENRYEILGFLTDNPSEWNTLCSLSGLPILGDESWILSKPKKSICVALGIGNPKIKKNVIEKIGDYAEFPSFVHPSVIRSGNVKIFDGAVITAGNILTTNITVEPYSMLGIGCRIGHDSVVGKYSVISPGTIVSGNVNIGEGAYLGAGSTIIERKSLGRWCIIGAGAVVIKDIPNGATAVGIPANVIKQNLVEI